MATVRELIRKQQSGEALTDQELARLEQARQELAQRREARAAPTPAQPAAVAPEPEPMGSTFLQSLGQFAQQNMPQSVGEVVTAPFRAHEGARQAVLGSDFVTGADRIPEGGDVFGQFPTSFQTANMSLPEQLRLRAGFFMDRRPEARADMIRNTLGDENVLFSEDDMGNTLVDALGTTAFLNRPGVNMQDAQDVMDDIIKFAPAGRVANVAGNFARQAPTVTGRIARGLGATGAASGSAAATEAVGQQLGQLFGSEQSVDPRDVALAGAAAGVGELATGAVQGLRPEARRLVNQADDMGIGLRQSPRNQVLQSRAAAQRMSPGPDDVIGTGRAAPRGEGLRGLREDFMERRTAAAGEAGAAFDRAREQGQRAFSPVEQVRELNQRVGRAIREGQFDVPERSLSAQLLRDLDQAASLEDGANLKIGALEGWRRNLNRRIDATIGGNQTDEQAKALMRVRREYDDWIQEQFVNDMVRGDPQAVAQWRDAREGWRSFKERFDGSDVLEKLRDLDMDNVESVRHIIFKGANLPTNTQAADTVRRLDAIFGSDSPQMRGLRAEVAADVTEPLFRETPDIQAFLRNYDTLSNRNSSLMRELWPDNLSDLEALATLARGISRRPGARVATDADPAVQRMLRLANAYTVGHGIAQGGARMELSRGIMDRMRETATGPAARRNILRQALGYDPMQPLLPRGTGAVAGQVARNETVTGQRDTDAQQLNRQPKDQSRPANLRSAIRKAKAGQELTPQEQALVQQARDRLSQQRQADQ